VQQVAKDIEINSQAQVQTFKENGATVSVVSGTQTKKILGLFTQEMEVQIKMDQEGNLIEIDRPWYAVFSW
jgi:hypothetical protein